MRNRLPSWILLLYVAIDLANPFVPGAFRFTQEEGLVWVEAAPHSREAVDPSASRGGERAPVPPRPGSGDEPRGSVETVRARPLAAWLVAIRTGDPPARDLPPPDTDEH